MATFEVVYWPGFSGRAQGIIYLLEDAGVDYSLNTQVEEFLQNTTAPVFACPVLKHGERIISQMAIIVAYLGKQLGYDVSSDQEFVALQFVANLSDVWAEAYSTRKQCEKSVEVFLAERLPRWLRVLERGVSASGSYALGDKVSYVDFLLLCIVNVIATSYGREATDKLLSENAPNLQRVSNQVRNRPAIHRYHESDRYNDVLYNFYTEEKFTCFKV